MDRLPEDFIERIGGAFPHGFLRLGGVGCAFPWVNNTYGGAEGSTGGIEGGGNGGGIGGGLGGGVGAGAIVTNSQQLMHVSELQSWQTPSG